jgi:hypothetical protein
VKLNAPLLFLLGLIAYVTSGAYGLAADAPNLVSQPGLFSYQAPAGWAVKASPMSKYPVALDAPQNGYSANINVVAESFPGSLKDYVAANKTALSSSKLFANVRFAHETAFQTASGLSGVRLVVLDTIGQLNLRQSFYIFPGHGDQKFVVTASSSADDGEKNSPIFDAALKTFSVP